MSQKAVIPAERQAGSEKRDGLLAQPGVAYGSYWRILYAFAALCVGAGCHSSLSGIGVQQKGDAGNVGDGFGA